jgi:hypothetical protein
MVKKIVALHDYLSAHDAAQQLSEKLGRPVSAKYIRSLSKRKKNPVRYEIVNNRFLYHKDDIMGTDIRERVNEEKEVKNA